MKTHLVKEIKILLIVLLSIAIGLTTIYLIYSIQSPRIHTQEILLYNSNSKAALDYKVQLMPNPIYNHRTMKPGGTYISIFTDTIDITYTYQFNGTTPSQIEGKYTLKLVMEGYSGKDKDFVSLWTKDYPIIKPNPFTINDNTYGAQETFKIPLNHYLTFVNQLDEAFPISSSRRLVLTCDTHMTSTTDDGMIENNHKNTLIIPLTNNFYTISGNLEDVKDGPIKRTEEMIIPISKNTIIFLSVLICLFILGLSYCIFFIIPVTVNEKEKTINALFKKHGSRLISLQMQMELLMVDQPIVYVCTFEGLVRISDELVQPIMYTYEESKIDINRFYVMHQNTLYCYAFDHERLTSQEQNELLSMIEDTDVPISEGS